MKSRKPGVLTIAVGTPASAPSSGQGHNDELGLAAAQEFLISVKNGNPTGVWESFKAMKEACAGSYDEGEMEE